MKFAMSTLAVVLAAAIVSPARAQTPATTNQIFTPAPYSGNGQTGVYSGVNSAFGAPGYYGMSYGTASYGVPRTYSEYPSSFGVGYGSGYPPYGFLPGRYGVGLWRPGFEAPGYSYGTSYYQTFPVPFRAVSYGGTPPVGMYAPGFGAPSYYGY